MQFHLTTLAEHVDLSRVERALWSVDPAALVDFDGDTAQLRVSTSLSALELIEAVDHAGYPIVEEHIVPQRSECCGGCGG